ncbi:MAG TPA: methyltransferase domain-containing protein, partial [Methylomirabilota bacterium]|nr:methyltransferase domain-containing protein [Methylomirabilota bacterium]
MSSSDARATNAYWGRDGLERKILDALAAAGKNVDALTIDDLAPADQFHGGGKPATERLARLAGLKPGTRVLDVGGGLGGPARTLAGQFGCRVTVVDLTESYVRAATALTARLGLADRVTHRVGDALALDVGGEPFDVVWTQNSGMSIADKERLYAGFARVLQPGGLLVTQEPMAGPVQPVVFPVMWARDASASFLRTPEAMRAVMEASGFQVRAWDDVTAEATGPASAAAIPAHSVQQIIMGESLDAIIRAGHQNREERRIVMTQAVL